MFNVMNVDREKVERLRETCRLLEIDIQELTSEIIESELSREKLIEELKNVRRQLYREFERVQESLNDLDINKNSESSRNSTL